MLVDHLLAVTENIDAFFNQKKKNGFHAEMLTAL